MSKTFAEVARDRFSRAVGERIFNGESVPRGRAYPAFFRELVRSPQGMFTHGGRRPHVLETVEFDDGSHLDILDGAVFAW